MSRLISALESMPIALMSHANTNGNLVHEKLVTQKGVLHRDISPNNMVFRCSKHGDRQVLLIDFNYAVHLDGTVTQFPKGMVSIEHYFVAAC